MLRGHHLNSAKYLKVNRLFLFIACLVMFVSFPFMVTILQIVFCLYACVQGELKQGQNMNIPHRNEKEVLQWQK